MIYGTKLLRYISLICHIIVAGLVLFAHNSYPMNDQSWIHEIQSQDAVGPSDGVKGEEVYTLTMGDFLQMPDVDFRQLINLDPHLRSLLN